MSIEVARLLLAVTLCTVSLGLAGASITDNHRVIINSGKRRQLLECPGPITDLPLNPTTTKAPVFDLEWLDAADQKVVAFTNRVGADVGGYWTSADGAKTWDERTQILTDALPEDSRAEGVQVLGVYAQKSAPNNIVLIGSGSFMWSSSDYGQTVRASQTPGKWKGSGIKNMLVHPWHDNWMLVHVKRPDCKMISHAQTECPYDLMLTQDLFGLMTWTNLTAQSNGKIAGFVDFDWGASLCPDKGCAPEMKVTDLTIMATMYAKAGDYDQTWDKDIRFVISNNNFVEFTTHVPCGNQFEVIGSRIYLAFANACPTGIDGKPRPAEDQIFNGIVLYTSSDGGNTFLQGCLPLALKQEGYEMMSTQDGTGAIIIVEFMIDNGFMDVPASSVYTAGPHHALFSLSLPDVYREERGFSSDFSKIEGLPGVYIANQMVARIAYGDGYTQYDYYDIAYTNQQPLVESRITFSGGAKWNRIPAPRNFNNVKCNRCDGSVACFLHLNGLSTWDSMTDSRPAVYSNPSAPGFIMATGVVASAGMGLEDDPEGTCTWLSTDGGVTWKDVAEGSYIYEYADWGSTIIMARHPDLRGIPANEIRFSVDYGACWQAVPLASALLVDNIRIESDGQRPRVVIHGRACEQTLDPKCTIANGTSRKAAPGGIMYTIDVKELMGDKMRDCTPEDYEDFIVPTNATDSTPACILGKQMRIQRRKPGSMCFNGPDYKRPQYQNTTCTCTIDADTECDYGYMRSGGKCTVIPKSNMPTCPVIDNHVYTTSSTGLRLVHADICTGIKDIIPDMGGNGTQPSPPPPPPNSALAPRPPPPIAKPPPPAGVPSSPPPPASQLPPPPDQQQDPQGGDAGGASPPGKKPGLSGGFKFFIVLLVLLLAAGAFAGWWMFMASELVKDRFRDAAYVVSAAIMGAYTSLRERITGRAPELREHDMGYFQPLNDGESTIFPIRGKGTEMQDF